MNDLISVDWDSQAPSQNPQQPTAPSTTAPSYSANLTNPPPSSARSSPLSARSITPVFRGLKAPPKTSAPANDSFSSLLGPKQAKPSDNLSLQERQRQLQLEKERQWKHLDSRPGPQDAAFWDNLGSGRSTPNSTPGAQSPGAASLSVASATTNIAAAHQSSTPQSHDEDDILAAFNSEAPVDASSHYPVPPTLQSSRANHYSPAAAHLNNISHAADVAANGSAGLADDDDDPFGLGQLASRPKPQASPRPTSPEQDDDILGDLGKPVSEVRRKTVESPHQEDGPSQGEKQPASDNDPRDRAVAELVDMGFPADKSAEALARTEGGIDIQAAVGYLLNQAHEEAKQKSQRRQGERGRDNSLAPEEGARRSREPKRGNRDDNTSDAVPAWMREQGSRSSSQRRQDGLPPTEEKDVAQYAQEFGTTFLKSANSLWKQGQKRMQKALADFDQPADPNQPKWMRDATVASNGSATRGPEPSRRRQQEATDEAMMLEPDMGRRQKPPARSSPNPEFGRASPSIPNRSPVPSRSSTPSHSQSATRPAKLTREAVEQQSAEAYVSPARRKKQPPATNPQQDLFTQAPSPLPTSLASTSEPQFASRNPFSPKASPAPPSAVRAPTPVRPKAPPRQVPAISPTALSTSALHRQKGTDAFKRGDYAAAHVAYSDALGPLPSTHPTRIVALCNRALTNIKVGDPKAAVTDADAALAIIGPSRGEDEKIVMGGTEADKDMKEFFGKALMRKAEGLEHMEKWTEAAKSWKEAVEAGIGGAVSIQGRNRCEKAAGKGSGPQSRTTNTPNPAVAAKKPPARIARPAVSTAASAQAVKKLREANQAAEKEDDEKFALSDQVEAKLVAWKGGKADNLRALLGSLDSVLWADAGWKKVGMQDLIMPNKVKIVYMKAIAKVHPDKIAQNATTEQKMISASVFATLNEAWDKFKKDNNL